MRRALLVAAMLLGLAQSALAVEPGEILADPAREARARALSSELRCMVCQNQSIDDSDAPLARDLRLLLRERIEVGDTDDEVTQFLVTRYGDFILLKPRLKPETVLLWATPALVLLAGIGLIFWSRRRPPNDGPLDPNEQAALRRVLAEDD
jgi:cytochrome c-type biogenesis protein CcmH